MRAYSTSGFGGFNQSQSQNVNSLFQVDRRTLQPLQSNFNKSKLPDWTSEGLSTARRAELRKLHFTKKHGEYLPYRTTLRQIVNKRKLARKKQRATVKIQEQQSIRFHEINKDLTFKVQDTDALNKMFYQCVHKVPSQMRYMVRFRHTRKIKEKNFNRRKSLTNFFKKVKKQKRRK